MTSREKQARSGYAVWRLALWLPAVLWMAVIFRFSSVPGSNVPGRYGTLAHFVEYAVLAVLLFVPVSRHTSGIARAAAFVLVIASFYAVTDEFHQAFVPGRVPDVTDWAVDTLGAALAALALGLTLTRKRKAAHKGRLS